MELIKKLPVPVVAYAQVPRGKTFLCYVDGDWELYVAAGAAPIRVSDGSPLCITNTTKVFLVTVTSVTYEED